MVIYDFNKNCISEDLFEEIIRGNRLTGENSILELLPNVRERYPELDEDDHSSINEFYESLLGGNIDNVKNKISEEVEKLSLSEEEKTIYIQLINDIEEEHVPMSLISRFSCSPYIAAHMITSARAFLLGLLSGHVTHFNTGITSNLDPDYYDRLKEVWENAYFNIHPFQKGATHQGAHHCHQVIENIDKIGSLSSLELDDSDVIDKKITKEEGFLLKIAAAVHDLGKSHTDYFDGHETMGYNYILHGYQKLKIPKEIAETIALIVKYHDGDQALHSSHSLLPDIKTFNYKKIDGTKIKFDIRLRSIAAVFRLADVMDLTHERVSEVVYDISKTTTPAIKYESERKILNRLRVKSVDFNETDFNIDVEPHTNLNITDVADLRTGIDHENKKLKRSGTKKVLDDIHVINEFNVK